MSHYCESETFAFNLLLTIFYPTGIIFSLSYSVTESPRGLSVLPCVTTFVLTYHTQILLS